VAARTSRVVFSSFPLAATGQMRRPDLPAPALADVAVAAARVGEPCRLLATRMRTERWP
jgi:hypothetical protein